MSQALPLLAVGEFKLILLLVIVILSVLGRVLGKLRERPLVKKGNPDMANPPRPNPGAKDPLADEVGDFLRRAAERRGPAKATGQAPPPARTPMSGRQEQPAAVILADEPDGGVAEHVRQRMRSDFKDMPKLDSEVEEADEQLEGHLHQVFDHQLSQLSLVPGDTAQAAAGTEPGSPTPQPGAALPLAASIRAMLANPATLRQAIVLNEILRRPEDRW